MKRSSLFLGAALALFWAASVKAGVITSASKFTLPGFSTGTLGPLGVTPAPNNDNSVPAGPNTIPVNVFFNSPGGMEIEFKVTDSGGVTEYRLPQTLINNSKQTWKGFRFELGFGTGADFVRAGSNGGLDFDVPGLDPAPFSSAFPNLTSQADLLLWTGGNVPSIGVAAFGLSIDVPDGVGRFTLRQTPLTAAAATPEPAASALLGTGLVVLATVLRRRRRG